MLNKKERAILDSKLKKIRLENDHTQPDMSRRCNISLRSYQRYELGERIPDVHLAIRIAEVLGIKNFTDFKELFKLPSENSSSEKQ